MARVAIVTVMTGVATMSAEEESSDLELQEIWTEMDSLRQLSSRDRELSPLPRAPTRRRSMIEPELKWLQTPVGTYASDVGGSITLLNGISEGTGPSERIGRKVCMKSITLKGWLAPVDARVPLSGMHRIMVVHDNAPNGSTPALTAILAQARPEAPMNMSNTKRFRIVLDNAFVSGGFYIKSDLAEVTLPNAEYAYSAELTGLIGVEEVVVSMSGSGTLTWAETGTITYSSYLPLGPSVHLLERYVYNPQDVFFGSTGGTVADVQSGAWWLVTVGSAPVGEGSNWSLAVNVRFTD